MNQPKVRPTSSMPSHKSHPASLDGVGGPPEVSDERRSEISSNSNDGGIVFSITKALAAATADEALAVVGVPHPTFHVSPAHHQHRQDGGCGSMDSPGLGNSVFYDDPDAVDASYAPDPVLTQKAIERTQAKIINIKEQIRLEQESRDENVNEFLILCANADKQQQSRMKLLFEKKNQKSAQNIAFLQKKLDEYQKKVKHLEEHGLHQRPTQKMRDKVQGLKNVGGNIRDTVMSKPKEFAHRLRHKFGSADNLTGLDEAKGMSDKETGSGHNNSCSLPRSNLGARRQLGSGPHRQSSLEDQAAQSEEGTGRRLSGDASEKSDVTSESNAQGGTSGGGGGGVREHGHAGVVGDPSLLSDDRSTEWKTVMQELNLHKEEVDRLREEIEESRQQFKREIETLLDHLREERERYERLEEQMNDLTELHQHEIENINSGVKDMEEKVQYQSEERLIDIKENIQTLETKLTTIEHQQQQQQQYINIEGLDSSDARVIFMKLLTAIITVIHVSLFFVGTFLSLAKPFLRTKIRILTTLLAVLVAVLVHHQQEDIRALFQRLLKHPEASVATQTT